MTRSPLPPVLPVVALMGALLLPGNAARAQPRGSRATRANLAPEVRAALDTLATRLGQAPQVVRRAEARASGAPRSRVAWVGGFRLPLPGATATERARAFLRDHGAVLGLLAPVRAKVQRVIPTRSGAVVRFALELDGRPVLSARVVVTVQAGAVTSAAGGLPVLATADGPQPVLDAQRARQGVERATGRAVYRMLGLGFLVRGDDARLVYRMDQYRQRPPERFLLAVDAVDGSILVLGRGLREAQGYVYDPSPAVAGGYESRPLAALTSPAHLEGTYARAWQCGPMSGSMEEIPCQNRAHVAAPTSAAGDYLIAPAEPSLSDQFAEVQGYYHATEYNQWLEQTFGFAWSCGNRRAIDVIVNMDYPNAFYGDADGDPEACPDITFGEGSIDYVYDAEVLYHEFGHGVVSQTAGLGCEDIGVCLDDRGLNLIPGGLNEGSADYLSMTYTGSPNLGEHSGQETGEPYIRTALNANQCPWDLMGQSHNDGHILMGGVWSLRASLGAPATDALFFATLAALPEDAEFDVAAATMQQAASDLQASGLLTATQVQAVTQMLGPGDRNMTGCDRVVPLDHRPLGNDMALAYGLPSYPGVIDEWPLTLQFRLDAPENARRLWISIEEQWGWGGGADWTAYLRRDQPVYIQVEMGSPMVQADHTFTGNPWDVILDTDDSPPLVPGSTYYLAVVYRADQDVLFGLRGQVETGPIIPPDGGVADAWVPPDATTRRDAYIPPDAHRPTAYQPESFDPRAGCACRGGGTGAPTLAFALLLLGWIVLRRRR